MKAPLVYVIDAPRPDYGALFRRGFAIGTGFLAALTLGYVCVVALSVRWG